MDQSAWQENVDRFYFSHGKCCAGCDWWRSISPLVGSCTRAKIVSGQERGDALGIDRCSLRIKSGHPVTRQGLAMASVPAGHRKIAPSHPGEVIADILDEQEISMRQAAAAIGMSPNGFNKVLLGQSPVTPETALRIGAYLGNGPDLWLNLQREHDLWHARKALAADIKKIVPVKLGTAMKR